MSKQKYYYLIWDKINNKPVMCHTGIGIEDLDPDRFEELVKLDQLEEVDEYVNSGAIVARND